MNAGENPRNQGRSVKAAPVRLQKAVSRSKEKRRSGAPRGERPTSLGVRRKAYRCYRAFRRSAPLTFVREHSPRERGDGKCRRSPRLAKTGAAELWVFLDQRAGCLKCESQIARENCVRAPQGGCQAKSSLARTNERLPAHVIAQA